VRRPLRVSQSRVLGHATCRPARLGTAYRVLYVIYPNRRPTKTPIGLLGCSAGLTAVCIDCATQWSGPSDGKTPFANS
jgi:hypothetical protein